MARRETGARIPICPREVRGEIPLLSIGELKRLLVATDALQTLKGPLLVPVGIHTFQTPS